METDDGRPQTEKAVCIEIHARFNLPGLPVSQLTFHVLRLVSHVCLLAVKFAYFLMDNIQIIK